MTGLIILIIAVVALIAYKLRAKKKQPYVLPKNARNILNKYVQFYTELEDSDKAIFERRIADFLASVTITGVGDVVVEDLDRILIASGAIIPIFAFPTWRYNNIAEVLLYKDSFNHEYKTEGTGRNVLGMVGDGAMNRQMILSKQSVRDSFARAADGNNTIIHEFVHLIDKADGSTDGVPEYLLNRQHMLPWLGLMHQTIADMKRTWQSDINLYGATNQAEFFAVVSEYFFEKPEQLQQKHPELYDMLKQMFQPVQEIQLPQQ